MVDIAKFSQLVGGLYDCVADPARWQRALRDLCEHFGGVLATIAVFDPAKNQARFAAHYGPPEVVVPLVTTYAALASYYHIMPRMEIDVPVNMEMFMAAEGPGAYARHMTEGRFNDEWRIPHGIADTLSLAVMKQDNRMGFFRIGTDDDHGPFTREELDEAAVLAPHIRRAVTIGDLFGEGRHAGDLFKEVIDNLSSAVFIVASDMKLLYANGLAQRMLGDGVAVSATANRIRFNSHIAHGAIHNAVEAGARDEVALGTAGLGVPLAPAERPAVAHVLPLGRRGEAAQFHQSAAAAIFVAAAGLSALPAMEAIAALFGLTTAEKRVAAQVAGGMTRTQIAMTSGVSDATVKSQLTAIYDKTGASGQRELELLIRDLTPPVNSHTK